MRKKIGLVLKRAFRSLSAGRRKYPDFLIIGAQKSGTSRLFRLIKQHPDVLPALQKEIHFFDHNFDKGAKWYKAHFPLIKNGKMAFEATPNYIYHKLVPERISITLTEAKFILVLRHPVKRAYSHFQMMQRRPAGSEQSFEAAVGKEIRLLEELKGELPLVSKHGYLAKSRYDLQLQQWLKHIQPERIHILQSEDLFRNQQEEMDKIFAFLGLKSIALQESKARINKGEYEKISPDTEALLNEYFRPVKEDLIKLLGKQFDWKL